MVAVMVAAPVATNFPIGAVIAVLSVALVAFGLDWRRSKTDRLIAVALGAFVCTVLASQAVAFADLYIPDIDCGTCCMVLPYWICYI